MDCDGSLSGEEHTNTLGINIEAPGEPGTRNGNAIEGVSL